MTLGKQEETCDDIFFIPIQVSKGLAEGSCLAGGSHWCTCCISPPVQKLYVEGPHNFTVTSLFCFTVTGLKRQLSHRRPAAQWYGGDVSKTSGIILCMCQVYGVYLLIFQSELHISTSKSPQVHTCVQAVSVPGGWRHLLIVKKYCAHLSPQSQQRYWEWQRGCLLEYNTGERC